ncbi:hypothetical protein M407DRAFT_18475 [Tulasnella calospora MUT 4182]|uniref:Uncharacterized protein n=1 Tax=Tulasnella calospora MUT 4182 TaxID=1051891 RepID=A0A0C3QJZ2_9AGAM|nr:hypothetical protein M407DRAFT_18475 [Tulasnella calospora MUT 4182]
MQVDENHDGGPRSSGSDHGDSGTPFRLGVKLMNKMNELKEWRIDPSSIEFPENTCQFHGGHATVSRAILDLGSDPRSDTDDMSDVDDSENTQTAHGSHSNTPRVKAVAVKMMKIEDANDRERVLGGSYRIGLGRIGWKSVGLETS